MHPVPRELRQDRHLTDTMKCVVTCGNPRGLGGDVTVPYKDQLPTRTACEMVGAFLAEREILRSTEKPRLVAAFGLMVSECLAPGMSRMLRTLRMARASRGGIRSWRWKNWTSSRR